MRVTICTKWAGAAGKNLWDDKKQQEKHPKITKNNRDELRWAD